MGQSSHKRHSPDVGILTQRRIEAGVIKPLVAAFEQELGAEKTREILARTISELAKSRGREMAEAAGDNGLMMFAELLEPWTRDGALELEITQSTQRELAFTVTRCRYAEMYRDMGLEDLGHVLSCNRDARLIEGFNPHVRFERQQTLMQGGDCCDFHYRMEGAVTDEVP